MPFNKAQAQDVLIQNNTMSTIQSSLFLLKSFSDHDTQNPFESITESFFQKRTSEFNKTGLTDYSDELIHVPKFLTTVIDKSANMLRNLPIIKHWVGPPFEHQEQLNKLLAQQKLATSYKEWFEISEKLDNFLQNDKWKLQDSSPLYDYKLIRDCLKTLHDARVNKDYLKLLYLVRTTWTRNLGNMGNVNLYCHSHVGTKKLIEDYIEECELTLEDLSSGDQCPLDDRYVLSMLLQTRKLIGRTALVLSGGGCFGLFHIGVLSDLLELNLLPKIISGSSAGAIIASILCVQSQEETINLISNIENQNFDIFESSLNKESILVNLARLLKHGTWFDNQYLHSTMKGFLGDLTFRESYNRTGRILNVTVSPASIHEQPTLLNYLTAPNVLIWSAVCASCSLPGIFPSSTIYEKTPIGYQQEWNHTSVKFVDGSVDNDLPITRLSEMFNVDHIIACQCNPHVVPFLKMSANSVGGELEDDLSVKFKKILNRCYDLCSSEVMHYLEVMSELGIFKNISTKLRSVIAQQYSGDITIIPDIRLTEMDKLLANPTPKFLLDATVRGARATWPKITVIKNHCSIEFALDRAISVLRSRLINTGIASSLLLINNNNNINNNNKTKMMKNRGDGGSGELPVNFKVSSPDKNIANLSRHRSETVSSGFVGLRDEPQLLYHLPQSHGITYKNSMPLMHGSNSNFDKKVLKNNRTRRRRRTLSNASHPDIARSFNEYDSRYSSNFSLPTSTTTTNPTSPLQLRTKNDYFSYDRDPHPISSTNKTYSQTRSSNQSISKINSQFFQNNSVPKVMQSEPIDNDDSTPTNLDPSDDDVIIKKITGSSYTDDSIESSSLSTEHDNDNNNDNDDDTDDDSW